LPTVEERLNLLERHNVVLTPKVEELTGQFQFISSQLASVQRYMHGRFDQIEGRFDKLEGRFDKVEGRMDRLEVKVDRLESEVVGLRRDLPTIVAETMREVLREQRSD
jgi:predicted nuclease with TOPRIM domain